MDKLFQAFSGTPYNKTRSIFEEYFHEQQQDKREVYLFFLNDRIIGYGTLVWNSPYPRFSEHQIPEIKDLNIIVEYRRHGYGTHLIKHMEERARERGHLILGIGAGLTPDYEAARRLYPSLGYISDGNGVHQTQWGDVIYFNKRL